MKWRIAALVGLVLGASYASADIVTLTLSLTDVPSMDLLGDGDNFIYSYDFTPTNYTNLHAIGVRYDVTLVAHDPSWLSDMFLQITDSGQVNGIWTRPGAGDDFPGTQTYTSGGMVDLVTLGLDFDLDTDNIVRFEWFESFDDFDGAMDGHWNGEVAVQFTADLVPEPASMAVLGLGALALLRRKRR